MLNRVVVGAPGSPGDRYVNGGCGQAWLQAIVAERPVRCREGRRHHG
jgi:CO/xanthine dehydrogenase Mo-binding subunit